MTPHDAFDPLTVLRAEDLPVQPDPGSQRDCGPGSRLL